MTLSNHDFLFHRSLNMRKRKGQIPLIIHHNESNQTKTDCMDLGRLSLHIIPA